MRFTAVVSCAFAALASSAAARPDLGPDGSRRLSHYEVVTFTDPGGNGINRGKAIGLFDGTPDEIFRVATEYDRYSEFAPHVVAAKVVDRQGDARALVMLNTDLPWPASKAWVYAQFEMDHLASDVFRVRFWQLRGSMKRYSGSIYIEPWQKWRGGGTSAVTYELLAEPDTSAPKRLINGRVEVAVAKFVHALRERVNFLRRSGRLHPLAAPNPALASPLAGPRPAPGGADVANAK